MTIEKNFNNLYIPKYYPVWWDTGLKYEDGYYRGEVINAIPYTGIYKEWFNAILRIVAGKTNRGWLEMAVKLNRKI